MKASLVLAANVALSLVRVGLADECHNICADVKKGVSSKSGCSAFRNSLPRPKVRRLHCASIDRYPKRDTCNMLIIYCDRARECSGLGHHLQQHYYTITSTKIASSLLSPTFRSLLFEKTQTSTPYFRADFKQMPIRLQGGRRYELLRRVCQWRIPSAVCF